jgi:hypothetical protein
MLLVESINYLYFYFLTHLTSEKDRKLCVDNLVYNMAKPKKMTVLNDIWSTCMLTAKN